MIARLDQACAYLRHLGDTVGSIYEVLTDPTRPRPMSDHLAAVAADHLVVSAMKMASPGDDGLD